MRTQRNPSRGPLTGASLVLCLLLLGSICACGSSDDTTFNPLGVLAQFAIVQTTTVTAQGSTTETFGAAIFWEGLLTKTVTDGSVSLVDPTGVSHPMSLFGSVHGSYYKTTDLLPGSFAFNSVYGFVVTLADGTVIPNNSAPTPSQDFTITRPALDQTVTRGQPLDVAWSNTTPGIVSISIRNSPLDIFNIIGFGTPRSDTGTARILEVNPGLSPGLGYLGITRKGLNDASAGGFGAGSTIYASVVDAVTVTLQ